MIVLHDGKFLWDKPAALVEMLIKENILSPIIMVHWKIAGCFFFFKVTIRLQMYPFFTEPWEEEILVALKLVRKGLDLEPIIMRI